MNRHYVCCTQCGEQLIQHRQYYYMPCLAKRSINSYNAALYSWSRLLLRQASPWVLTCGQSFFPILWVIKLHWYRKFVKCIAIIIPTCHSQDRRSAWNPLFSIMGQIDQVKRRFNLDPTTPNCIYLGTLN